MADIQQIQNYYEGAVEPIYRAVFGAALHLAMFETDHETRDEAQTRTKEFLISHLPGVTRNTTIIDLGSGYGDMARYLAQKFGCRVMGFNLVHTQNVLAHKFSREAGVGELVSAVGADFARAPLQSSCTRIVWCQEALLHAPDRSKVINEAARLLKPGGAFIFTDLLQTGPMEEEEAQLIYKRVSIHSFETFESYRRHVHKAGLALETVADLSHYVAQSYSNHIDEMREAYDVLVEAISPEFIDYTITAMGRWVAAAEEGKLGWGMFVARKP